MSASLEISVDLTDITKRLSSDLGKISGTMQQRVYKRAIASVTRKGKTNITRALKQVSGHKYGYIRSRIVIKFPQPDEGHLIVKDSHTSVKQFGFTASKPRAPGRDPSTGRFIASKRKSWIKHKAYGPTQKTKRFDGAYVNKNGTPIAKGYRDKPGAMQGPNLARELSDPKKPLKDKTERDLVRHLGQEIERLWSVELN